MFDPSRYTVGWVCAIPPELVAARLHLETEHDADAFEAPLNDNNTYVFGSIGKHNIVVAALPSGEYGISSAAGVARDLIRSFTNVRIGLMVGIAGGAPLVDPDEKNGQDIRLGDVVVSIPTNGRGGVCQYDYGKAVQGHELRLTGHLDSPPSSLLTAITALKTDFELNGYDLNEDVSAALAARRRRKLEKDYQRPDACTDRLYKSSFVHVDDAQSCSRLCNIDEQIVKRVVRDEGEDVMIHYGLIASANTLQKDALSRDKLAREIGVLCFEMEAAGLSNQFPFLVIRGICDYSDSHKNKDWQRYAAMTAAAYTKKLLLRLLPNKVKEEQKLSELKEIKENMEHVVNEVNRISLQNAELLFQGLERWLDAPDESTNHINASQSCHQGTGSWVFDSSVFYEWQEGKFPVLWLHGISGCGKTVLASTIIQHLRTNRKADELILYFYFDVQDARKQKLDHVLRSLIKQLCCVRQVSQSHIESLYDFYQRGRSQPTTLHLSRCFEKMCKDKSTVIVLDALDECTPRGEVLNWIQSVSNLNGMRIIVTSRTEHDIKQAITKFVPPDAILAIKGDLLDEDIRKYVHFRIYNGRDGMERWQRNPLIQQDIEEKLMKKAKGMFRWVFCQLDALRQCLDPKSLRTALESLPEGLDETYNRILRQIPNAHLPNAVKLLQFLVFSERPLELEEAVDALATDPNEVPAFRVRDRMPVPQEIAHLCASLIMVTGHKIASPWEDVRALQHEAAVLEVVQLAHPSVREYFLSDRLEEKFRGDFRESRAKACIVEVSLAYLYEASRRSFAQPMFDLFITQKLAALHEKFRDTQLPFLTFAARYWIKHAPSAEREGESVLSWIYRLFTSDKFYMYWLRNHRPDELYQRYASGAKLPDPLYYASLGGLTVSVERLLDKGADVNADGGLYGNPLQAVSSTGHTEMVKLLLDRGADINKGGGWFGSALQAASCGSHTETVKLLIGRGADVNAKGGLNNSALQAAATEGHVDAVKLLLNGGVDLNADTDLFANTLEAASSKGHTEIVKLLLDKMADRDIQTSSGTNLQGTSSGGHTETAKLRLERSADLDKAIEVASCKSHIEIVQLLLDRGADVDKALEAALLTGHTEMVRLLLGKGADVYKALEVALRLNHTAMVQLLLDQRPDINMDKALGAALRWGRIERAQALLDKGANMDVDKELKPALDSGRAETVQFLLDRGAEISMDEAFKAAVRLNHTDLVWLLLDRGADVDVDDALKVTYLGDHREMAKVLIEKGGKASKFLLEKGVDADEISERDIRRFSTALRLWLLDRRREIDAAFDPTAAKRRFALIERQRRRRRYRPKLLPQTSQPASDLPIR